MCRGAWKNQDSSRAGPGLTERGETGGESVVVPPLPVFLFPSELVFYSGQRNSHRRVLTLYNPYRFRISFKSQYLSVCLSVCLCNCLSVCLSV
uniref:Motile sperm domain-containing protein 1 n=1 Tax=Seriola lalandi dorsalis TaxID=1841481 RepID=A0A3B4WW24_SERLL